MDDKPEIVSVVVRMPPASRQWLKGKAADEGVSVEEFVRTRLGIPNPGTLEWMRAIVSQSEGGDDASTTQKS